MIKIFHSGASIKKFEGELYQALERGYIFRFDHLKRPKMPSAIPQIVGVEILFSDIVTDKQIKSIKEYIEYTYKFVVNDTFLEVGKTPKIMLVEY